MLVPVYVKFGQLLSRLLPANLVRTVQVLLIQAGQPMTLQAFLTFWFVMASASVVFVLLILGPSFSFMRLIIWGGFCLAFGFSVPYGLLNRRARKRRRQIERALPDGLDLLLSSVEAGLGIDAAFALVAERTRGPLAETFTEYLRQVGLGRSRRDALADIAQRSGAEGLVRMSVIVSQASEVGSSLSDILRIQAAELRADRRVKAQEAAQRVPVMMAIPLALCFLPAMVAVVVVPSILNMLNYVGDLGK
jgi:tight adherence protein C